MFERGCRVATAGLGLVALVAGVGLVSATSAAAKAAACDPEHASTVAIGSPGADVGGVKDAGSVEIRNACSGAVVQTLTLPDPQAGERFGASAAPVSLGVNGYFIGIPQYNVGSVVDAGAIAYYRHTDTGYVLDRIVTQNSPGVPGDAQAGAKFGTVMKALLEPGEGAYDYVTVGMPRWDVGTAKDAGAVVKLTYSTDQEATGTPIGELVPGQTTLLTLNSPGMPWVAHTGDLFGWSIGGDFGAPGRTVQGHPNAGAAYDGVRWITQATPCVPGVPETGDRFGAATAGDWIGVPGEDLDGVRHAGMVNRYAETKNGTFECNTLSEKTTGLQGKLHVDDQFGAALVEAAEYDENGVYNPQQIYIGAPGADTSKGANSGTVSWVREDFDGTARRTTLTERGVTPGPRAGAALGTALGLGYASSRGYGFVLFADAPGGRGVVNAYRSSTTTLTLDHTCNPSGLQDGVYGTALSSFTF